MSFGKKSKGASIALVFLLLALPVLSYHHDKSSIQWHDYNQESFDKAVEQDKPVFMLVTAIWCYWCHVYWDESLHDQEVIDQLNKEFIPVFVDADKRQDLTRQYLAGGWPSSVFFSPDGREVSRVNGHIRKDNLQEYMNRVSGFFKFNNLPDDYDKRTTELRTYKVIPGKKELGSLISNVPEILQRSHDSRYGGFGSGQKFPQALAWDYLLDEYERTKDAKYLIPVEKTLQGMAPLSYIDDWDKPLDLGETNGLRNFQDERIYLGVYDPVEGGFFRYSTTREWTIPHYEKMLNANANNIMLYLHAYEITKKQRYKEIAEKSLQYVFDKWKSPDGGFYGSQDAGHEIYYRQKPEIRLSSNTEEPSPRIDFSIYADWNAPMILAMFNAHTVLGDEKYREAGVDALAFFKDNMVQKEGVDHVFDEKGARLNGLLLDNAYIILAFLEGYAQTKDDSYKKIALDIVDYALSQLYNPQVGAFIERHSTDTHLYVGDEYKLEEIPYTANSVMALSLAKAFEVSGKQKYLEKANEIIGYFYENVGGFEDVTFQAKAARIVLENKKGLKEVEERVESGNLSIPSGISLTPFLFLIAFLIGVLSFLSPCTLPVLPAYFAYTLGGQKGRIARNTFSFFLGLLFLFTLLGMSATFLGSYLGEQLRSLSIIFGIAVILFGFMAVFGKGFVFKRIPMKQNIINTTPGSFLFGMAFAIGWSPCIGPLLGGIFILASQASTTLAGGLLLALYAAGLALPLILLSLYVDKLDKQGWLWKIMRGKQVEFAFFKKKIHIHTTSLISGIILILLGFLILSGTLYSLNQFVAKTSVQAWIYGLEESLLNLLS